MGPDGACRPALFTYRRRPATATRFDVHPDLASLLAEGRTLPAEWYTNPTIFEHERDRIFARSWQYVCLQEQLQSQGDFVTCRIGKTPFVIVRDLDQNLRAFVNVCRHRGSELVLAPCGNRKSIQCHYHAWTYGLDGALRAAPGSRDEAEFRKEEFGLVPVRVETWGPFVFINPDPGAAPLLTILGELPNLVEATGLDLPAIKRRVRHEYIIEANWKIVVDNYLECYHCPTAHPGFTDLIDVNNYHVREYEYFSTQTGNLKESARDGGVYTIGDGVEDGFYAFLWPTFMVNIYPGPGNVSLNLIEPIDVARTRAVYEYCFVDGVSEREEQEFVAFIDQVQREDIVLCESVQRGLRSGYFDQGKLMLEREAALRHFQQLVHRAISID